METSAVKDILLVEDHLANVYLVQKALAECCKEIHLSVVTDGQDALAFLRHAAPFEHAPCPALIISDLHLPRLDASEFLADLRRLPAHHTTPVVIFSVADKDTEEVRRCLRLGATAYVQKPADPYDYFAAIRTMVSTWLRQHGAR